MRGTEAKRLRKLAREATEDKPERNLVGLAHNRIVRLPDGDKKITSIQVINHPESTRGVYRMLKKNRAVTIQPKGEDHEAFRISEPL